MGLTIQDMLITSENQYQMKMIAGANGWSNSISWVLMVEDTAILNNFTGKELAVTTGLGFTTADKLINLAKHLVEKHAAGMIINTGEYVLEIPKELIAYCDENDLPLIEVPWKVYIGDMIKDLSVRIFLEETADDQIANALIKAIETPDNQEDYRKELLPYYDVDGEFQVVLFTTEGLDTMDTVERRKLSYRLQIYVENLTHNGNFFYYDSNFVLMMNDVSQRDYDEIVGGMLDRTHRRMPDIKLYCGAGSKVQDISQLYISYRRAKAAVKRAVCQKDMYVKFDDMGLYRLLYMVDDKKLLREMSEELLKPLIEYDKKHKSSYVETLELYLRHNGSIQAVAEQTFTHRNTVIYRISNIKKLLNTEFDSAEEKMKYLTALYIRNMN